MKIILLTRGKTTKVSNRDYRFLSLWKWRVNCYGYAVRAKNSVEVSETKRTGDILMHRVILEAKVGQEVDHKDGDRLNNQRSNIRIASHAENQRNKKLYKTNKSGVKGVYYDSSRWNRLSRWRALIGFNGRQKTIGYFMSLNDAKNAYNKEAKKLHGDFARLNK